MRRRCRIFAALTALVLVGAGTAAVAEEPADTATGAPTMTRAEALEAVADADAWTRVRGLRALLEHGKPGDEPLLGTSLADPQDTVSIAAAQALAALGTAEALALLDSALASTNAPRREGAALALLVHAEPPLDAELEARARLQVVSQEGRRWLDGRELYLEIRALRADHAEVLAQLGALAVDPALAPACVTAEAAILGVELEGVVADPRRAERFWREGRLDRLPDERIRLQTAVQAAPTLLEAAQARCVAGSETSGGLATPVPGPPPGGVVPVDPAARFAAFLAGPDDKQTVVVLGFHGHVGHDNHTFLLNPALRVSEPGPHQGEPIDLRRDDTFGALRASLSWLLPLQGTTALGSDPVLPLDERTNVLLARLEAGYEGRLRWGQLMGPDATLEVIYDTWGPATPDELQHWRLEVDGGLVVPDWAEEADVTLAPVQRAGGRARFDWADVAVPPTREREAVDRLRVGLETSGWAATEVRDDAQGIEPPELWWMNLQTDVEWHFAALDAAEDLWLGALGELGTRLSDGDAGHGASALAGLRMSAILAEEALLTFDLGYGLALPFGDADAQARTGPAQVAVERELEHAPLVRGHLRFRAEEDEALIEVHLDLAHRLGLAGRYGWVAQLDRADFGLDVSAPLGLRVSGLSLFVERAHYPRGEAVSDLVGAALEGSGDVELIVAGFDVQLPLYFDRWFVIGVLGEGRLASDTARFEGRYEGQFRVQALTTLHWDLLDSEDLHDSLWDYDDYDPYY